MRSLSGFDTAQNNDKETGLSQITLPKYLTLLFLTTTLALTGCQYADSSPVITQKNNHSAHNDMSQQTLRQQALRIQRALANKDYARIIDDIHPTRGTRFSMYTHVRPETDKVFSREQYAQYLDESNVRFTWGDLDGTGDPLVTTLPKYLDTWVAANQYNDAILSVNEFKHSGNTINNIDKIYQNSDVVEFYYKGSEQYSGMDWRIMRLVFDDYQGKRYLVAVVNNQWTT